MNEKERKGRKGALATDEHHVGTVAQFALSEGGRIWQSFSGKQVHLMALMACGLMAGR